MAKRRTKDLTLADPAPAAPPADPRHTAEALDPGDRQAFYIAFLEHQLAAQKADHALGDLRQALALLCRRYRATGIDPATGQITREPPKDPAA